MVNALLVLAAGAAVLLVLKVASGRRGDVRGEEARKLVAGGARLLDVRTSREFAAGHLPGAVNIPLGISGSACTRSGRRTAPSSPTARVGSAAGSQNGC